MSDRLSDWREGFFDIRRDLAFRPDGRALYAYRLTDTEFQTLGEVLRDRIDTVSSLDFLARHHPDFAGLFVLYAAEWWRRRYCGGRWRWEPIEKELHIGNGWNSNQRGECVERGLYEYWKIGCTGSQGHRFLGAIARQGGLPRQLLRAESGRLGRLLRDVIRLARGGNYSVGTLRGWVVSLENLLPDSYRGEEILDLLAEVVTTALSLVREIPEKEKADALQWLNRNRSDWRERFPFPMDDQSLHGLLGELIQDAAASPIMGATEQTLAVERRLEPEDGEIWALRSSFELPERIPTRELVRFFEIPEGKPLPRGLVMTLHAGGSITRLRLERLAGHDTCYRLNRQPWHSSGEDSAGDHFLDLSAAEGCAWHGLPRNGIALAPELPWLFAEDHSGWRWLRQGGGGIPSAEGMVAIPSDWKIAGDQVKLAALLKSPERDLYRVAGKARITCPSSGRIWRMHTDDASAIQSDWHWQGQRVWEEFISPTLGFWGRPRLYVGHTAKPGLTWTLQGREASPEIYGPLEVCLESDGEKNYCARMVVLPQGARVEIRPQGPMDGIIRLSGWGAIGAESKTPGLPCETKQETDALCLLFAWNKGALSASPPEWVELCLVWPANPNPARLRFPFPGQGVHAYDGEGRELDRDSWLPTHRLAGARLVAVGIEKLELRFTLRYPKEQLHEGPSSQYAIQRPTGASRIEIRLQEFTKTLERLFSADELLDAWVEATITANHQEWFKLRLSRYLCPLERVAPNVALTPEGLRLIAAARLETLPVLALRLEAPRDEPVALEPCRSEEVCAGAWNFLTVDREPGSWLIYPGADAEERFRPTLWNLPGEQPTGSRLTQAIAITHRPGRAAALDEVIAALATDYVDPGWSELEYLAGHLGHLPLASFDLWRRFAHSPAGMAALALRMSGLPHGFVQRFTVELPFVWELVPYKAWRESVSRLRAQCTAWFGESAAAQELSKFLCVVLDRIGPAILILASLH